MRGEAATKSKGEGGDDDARDDWASFSLSMNDRVKHGEWIKDAWTPSNLA
jgi:hypothetical protein